MSICARGSQSRSLQRAGEQFGDTSSILLDSRPLWEDNPSKSLAKESALLWEVQYVLPTTASWRASS